MWYSMYIAQQWDKNKCCSRDTFFSSFQKLLTSHSRPSRRKSSSLSNFDFCSGTTRGILKKNRGFGCSYKPIESYGIMPANASFIILIDFFKFTVTALFFDLKLHLMISSCQWSIFFGLVFTRFFFLFSKTWTQFTNFLYFHKKNVILFERSM